MIGRSGERGSGISVLAARHDDDDCYLTLIILLVSVYNVNRLIDLAGRGFANDPGDMGSIPGHVITKTLKMVLDASLLNTQQYKVHIKGKVEQSRERIKEHETNFSQS